jgi:FKBP-type peptidyl-prolyl cis-trans isomerase
MTRSIKILFILIIILSGCKKPNQKYKQVNNQIAYRLVSFADDANKCRLFSIYQADIIIFSSTDSLIYKSKYKENFIFNNSSIDTLFNFMHVGDSMQFLVNGKFLQKCLNKPLSDTNKYSVYIKVNKELTEKDINQSAAKREFNELYLLKKYIDSLAIPIEDFSQGYFEEFFTYGTGDTLRSGDVAFLNYYGTFLNGEVFDSTATKQNLFDYTCGVKGQVIPAFEKALYGKVEGDSFKLIIPSIYAFGEEGSSTLIVPPATSVIYYIKVDSILKKEQITGIQK